MGAKVEFYVIIGLIWVSASVYTGLLVYKAYLRNQDEAAVTEQQRSARRPSALYAPVSTEREWNARADQIRRDHRNLVNHYKQRQRDHQRITRNLMRRNKF